MRRAVFLRFAERFLRPRARHDEVGRLARAEQVHRHDRVFGNTAALQEQDPVACRHAEQVAQVGQRGLVDRHELLAAMAHLHHAHTAAVPVEHFVGGLPQHFLGHRRRAGGEIKDAHRENLGGTRPARRRQNAPEKKWPLALARKRPLSHCRQAPAKPGRTAGGVPGRLYLPGLTAATSLSACVRVAWIACGMYFCIRPLTTSRPT